MVSVEVINAREIQRDLQKLGKSVAKQTQRAIEEVGRIVQTEAKLRCPVSPTKAQAKGTKYSYDAKKSPNTLKNGIKLFKGSGVVIVGVVSGAALAYADFIHNQQYKSWFFLGPGSLKKGSSVDVGGKFIDRAFTENRSELEGIIERSVNESVKIFNRV